MASGLRTGAGGAARLRVAGEGGISKKRTVGGGSDGDDRRDGDSDVPAERVRSGGERRNRASGVGWGLTQAQTQPIHTSW